MSIVVCWADSLITAFIISVYQRTRLDNLTQKVLFKDPLLRYNGEKERR